MKSFNCLIIPLIALLLVAGPVNAFMSGSAGSNYQTGGNQFKGQGGKGNGGPKWEGTGTQRPLDKGFSFNGNGSGPEVALVDNSSRGVSIRLSSIEFFGNEKHLGLDVVNHTWYMNESTGPAGQIDRAYKSKIAWSPGGPVANLTSSFGLIWNEFSRMMMFRFHIDLLPGNGTLRLTYRFQSESASSWGSGHWRSGNGELSLGNDDGVEFCEVNHSSIFIYSIDEENKTGPLSVSGIASSEEAMLITEGAVRSDITSVELEGSMTLFDPFILGIVEKVEEGVDFVMDHILSFLIGGTIITVITLLILTVMTLKRKDGADGLVLERNRYYKRPKGPCR